VNIDRKRFGNWVKKERKKKGFKRQEDLVDDVLSQSVISYIESGNGQVSKSKIVYLLKRLGFDEKKIEAFELSSIPEEDTTFLEEIQLRLISAENIIDLVSPDEGMSQLDHLSMPKQDEIHVTVEYLKGKIYYGKKNWSKAFHHFMQSIHTIEQNIYLKKTNLESACYHEIGRMEYSQNKFYSAINYGKKALSHFQNDGERLYYRDLILVSQVIYLEKLNQIGEAQKILDQMNSSPFSHMYLSGTKEAALNAYEVHAKFLQRGKQFPQAINMALKGIELARIDKMYDRSFELWVTLGSIYSEMDKAHLAEICFKTALKLKHQIKRTYLLAYVYTQLGKLYDKKEERDRAEREFQQAIKYSRKTNDVYREIDALSGLGETYLHQQKYEQAVKVLNEALDLAKSHRFSEKTNWLLLLVGQCLVEMGDPDLQNIALDFFYSHLQSIEGGETMIAYSTKRHSAGDPPGG
jgi:tetratricopeptide (TPR) repeat protein